MDTRTEPAGFTIIQFLFWFALVTFEAFMVPYLRGEGYTPGQIGPVMGAVFGLSIVGQPVLGTIVDRVTSPKRIISGTLVIAAVTVAITPIIVAWYPAILVIALVYSVTANSLPAVLDGWIMMRREENPRINYGIARGFGSAGFAIGAIAIGMVADRVGTSIIFPIYFVTVIVMAAVVLGIPTLHRTKSQPISRQSTSRRRTSFNIFRENVAAVTANGPYLVLLVSSYLAFVGLRAALTFLPILVEELNGSVSDVGIAHSVAAVSEVPFFFLSAIILLRIRGPRLIAAILSLLSVRLFTYTLLSHTGQLFFLQTSHGLTFGLFLAATVDYIHRIAPPEHRSFFQALAPSVYFGLGSITGSWLGGVIIESYSTLVMYRWSASIALVGAIVFCTATVALRRRRTSESQSNPLVSTD